MTKFVKEEVLNAKPGESAYVPGDAELINLDHVKRISRAIVPVNDGGEVKHDEVTALLMLDADGKEVKVLVDREFNQFQRRWIKLYERP